MKLKGTLEALYSERDRYGNCYWALRYTSHATGRQVRGTVSGGESNIYAILRETDAARASGEWDRSILFRVVPLQIRQFNNLTDDWPHAGCSPDDLYQFIKHGLRKRVQS